MLDFYGIHVGKCTIWKHGSYMGIGSTTYPTLMDEGKGSTAIFAALCKGRSAVQLISSSATGSSPQFWSTSSIDVWFLRMETNKRGGKTPKKLPFHGWHPERVQVVKYNDFQHFEEIERFLCPGTSWSSRVFKHASCISIIGKDRWKSIEAYVWSPTQTSCTISLAKPSRWP